jgi:(R)-2-hydroxyacyl-CoA dehydratese activating ATPase
MTFTAGVDLGSTYAKAAVVGADGRLVGRSMLGTGFRLAEAAQSVYHEALTQAGLAPSDVAYVVATGYGRYQVLFRDAQATDLTAQARGACFFFPETRTILDVGGQTMKASRIDERAKVRSFRLNDKCAAGTGTFLEKTARYLGYRIEEVGPLMATAKEAVPISGVCAVFAESEVINHVSSGCAPADIMYGAVVSLSDRAVQLMKRVNLEPEFTLVGGIMRFARMVEVVSERLKASVNVPPGDLVQYTGAIGAALLGARRLEKLLAEGRPQASTPQHIPASSAPAPGIR